MLWLFLHLPRLPLEVFLRGVEGCGPAVVAENGLVRVAERKAQARGVRPGMAVGAARALVEGLQVFERAVEREREALAGLACWAGQFTPHVSLEGDGLLLEIGGCLRLFGGLERLVEKACRGVRMLGWHAVPAVAPTALGAAWLARAGRPARLTDAGRLAEHLARLPVTVLETEADHHDMLAAMGLVTLGETLALPRAGLAKRFGGALLDQLDRALGRVPDPRPWFEPPARFASRLELPAEVQDSGALLFAARRLVHELEGFLRARGAGVQRFHLELGHGGGATTQVTVGLASPARDAQRLLLLLRERLERLTLPRPVREIRLRAEQLTPCRPRNLELFPDARREEEGPARLIERLRARLGEGRVYGLACVADHRPERAMRTGEPGTATRMGRVPRPLWLLSRPRPLPSRGGVPRLGGALLLREGPERIESGWWDGQPVARDYFVAEAPGGARYWVFRGAEGGWFLHGIFA